MRLKINKKALEGLTGTQREEAEEALQKLEQERRRNPLAFYEPHAKQKAFHEFTAHTKCFFGGTQSGKTTGSLNDDIIQALDRNMVPEHLIAYKKFEPPFECRIMSGSFKLLENNVVSKLQEMIPASQLVGGSWKTAYDKQLGVLYFSNGSKFFFMTYETEVKLQQGVTLDRVHFDEEPPLAVFNENRWRVSAKEGDLVFSMTPTEGITWTYDQLWMQRGTEVRPEVFKGDDLECVQVMQDDNPALSQKQIELGLKGLSEEEKAARREGKFVALHGLIYADFDQGRHVVPQRPLPSNVNVVVGIDPGIRNRTAVVWMYLTPDDQMVVFEEGYYEGMTVRQVSEHILHTNARYDIHPLYYVIDPAARNKNHQTGRSDQMEYADHGIVTIAGQNSVTAGINRIRERFQSERIFISDNCIHLVDELHKYRWKQPPRSGEDSRQAPVKKDDHLVDALRYAVMSRPYLPEEMQHRDETKLQRMMREDIESYSQPQEQAISQFAA